MVAFTSAGVPLYAWPNDIKPSEVTLHLRSNTSSFTSPFTRTTQTTELPGALHDLAASFPSVADTQARALRAFFARLRGQAGRFHFPAYCCRYAPPAMYGRERVTFITLTADNTTIRADATDITADATYVQYESVFTVSTVPDAVTLVGTLWLNSRKAPLQIGGFISFDDATGWRHLHTIVDMVHAATSGQATLTLEPPLRSVPLPSTPIHVHAPSGVFMLADDGQGALRLAGGKHSFTISAVQAFPLQFGDAPVGFDAPPVVVVPPGYTMDYITEDYIEEDYIA